MDHLGRCSLAPTCHLLKGPWQQRCMLSEELSLCCSNQYYHLPGPHIPDFANIVSCLEHYGRPLAFRPDHGFYDMIAAEGAMFRMCLLRSRTGSFCHSMDGTQFLLRQCCPGNFLWISLFLALTSDEGGTNVYCPVAHWHNLYRYGLSYGSSVLLGWNVGSLSTISTKHIQHSDR